VASAGYTCESMNSSSVSWSSRVLGLSSKSVAASSGREA